MTDLSSATVYLTNTAVTLISNGFNHVAFGYDPAAAQLWIQCNGSNRNTLSCSGILRGERLDHSAERYRPSLYRVMMGLGIGLRQQPGVGAFRLRQRLGVSV